MKKILITVAVLLLFCAPAGAGLKEGAVAYKKGDYATALKEIRPLAEQGNAAAQFNLGFMYANGNDVPKDYKEAVKWYRKAAEQGYAPAQNNLGLMYANGQGVPKDYVLAYKWVNLAHAQGNEGATEAINILEKMMTPAQIAQGQKLSREFKIK